MNLLIDIKDRKVSISFLDKKKKDKPVNFPEENNLSEKLLVNIDRLLKKNRLSSKDIKKVTVKTDELSGFTTSRIARSVAKAYNFAVGNV